MNKKELSRRQFIQGAAGVALAASQTLAFSAAPKTATDQVILGNTGIKLSRLGIGTGTQSGSVQRSLGHEKFNNLIRYAYDRGITYVDTADSYQTHPWVREAIQGIPREKLYIQSKIPFMGTRGGMGNHLATLDRFRKELNVDYIDTVLIHCQISADWDEQTKALRDAMEEAKQKKIIRAHGVSCHSLPALQKAAALGWVDVNLVRINPQGVNIDTPQAAVFNTSNESHVPAVVKQLKTMRENGHGIIGMKLVGQGELRTVEERKRSLTWVMQNNLVDAVVIGMKSKEELDEAISHINRAFAG
jgi:predicted aldo/keto reductase-like oxidoreductase